MSPPQRLPALSDELCAIGAREEAAERESLEAFSKFFERSMRFRTWSPWRDLPLAEIRHLSSKLSADTICLLEGFLGIEEFIGDYASQGLETLRTNRVWRNVVLQWAAEEMRHGAALEQVLLHSEVRSTHQVAQYTQELLQQHWLSAHHRGMDAPLGVALYAMIQERATYINYEQLRLRVRHEYGLPVTTTPEERRLGRELGVSEVLRKIAADEIAHHGLFLQLVRIQLRYFPEATIEKMKEVLDHFRMPAVRLIPRHKEFVRALLRTDIYHGKKHQQKVVLPTLQALGFKDPDDLCLLSGLTSEPRKI